MHVDIAARIGELGRQPRTSRKFFDKYQDRIVFATDATPHGDEFPQQVFNEQLYEIYYRFLETEDEYFDYAPAKIPPQGRWRIYGIDLPDQILRKVYNGNAARGCCKSRSKCEPANWRVLNTRLALSDHVPSVSAAHRSASGREHSPCRPMKKDLPDPESSIRPVRHQPLQLSLHAAQQPHQPARGPRLARGLSGK